MTADDLHPKRLQKKNDSYKSFVWPRPLYNSEFHIPLANNHHHHSQIITITPQNSGLH